MFSSILNQSPVTSAKTCHGSIHSYRAHAVAVGVQANHQSSTWVGPFEKCNDGIRSRFEIPILSVWESV